MENKQCICLQSLQKPEKSNNTAQRIQIATVLNVHFHAAGGVLLLSVLFMTNSALSTHPSLLCKYSANFKLPSEKLFRVERVETCMSWGSFVGETASVGDFFSQYNVFLLGHAKERSIVSGCVDKESCVLQHPKGG